MAQVDPSQPLTVGGALSQVAAKSSGGEPVKPFKVESGGGDGFKSFDDWLGTKENIKQFKSSLCQAVASECQKQRAKSAKMAAYTKAQIQGDDNAELPF